MVNSLCGGHLWLAQYFHKHDDERQIIVNAARGYIKNKDVTGAAGVAYGAQFYCGCHLLR